MNTEDAGTVTVKQATARYVDMPETRFQGGDENTALYRPYDATNNVPEPETELPVTPVLLGEGRVDVTFTGDSFAELLQDPNGAVRVSADELSVPDELVSLNVEGETSGRSSQSGFSLADSTIKTYGFLLGGVDIPYPGPHTLGDGGSTFSLKLSDANCQLKWVSRNRNTENASDRPIKVLAFDNCSTSGVSWVEISGGSPQYPFPYTGEFNPCPGGWWQHSGNTSSGIGAPSASTCSSASDVGKLYWAYWIEYDDITPQMQDWCKVTATKYQCKSHQ
ncbi:MAG: hypothetical protein MJ053_07040 [Elusimicrobiaceae bacterium]|nr:hypothetical protein [Elusimicrobiaceae bacterium]